MGKFENTKENKKQLKKYVRLGLAGALVVLLAVMPMLAASRDGGNSTQASILSATVETKTIDTQIIGGGQLSSEASLNVRIPENVKLTQYLVGNGDTVKEGETIAKVDKISVMTAITEVQETLDYLAQKIASASDDTASTSVKALAGGTVKVIYAKEGESVQDVMLDHGSLAILSLDDTMAVQIEKETTLDVGDTVIVTLADGTEVDGRVKTNLKGVLTITVEDDDYSVGAKVTASTEAGEVLGTGELYILSPWSATAYSGYVKDILVEENDSVYIGRTLFSLEDTGNSAQFQRLIDQRQEYEELMQELFIMYRTESITAPCDGIITGVDEDGAYLLSDSGSGWFASLLSFFGTEKDGFKAYTASVTEVNGSGMELLLNPKVTYIEDLTDVSDITADLDAMTQSWEYTGDTTVYTQDENGLLQIAGDASTGDTLLAIGDEEQVHWFVKIESGEEKRATTLTASLCSDVESGADSQIVHTQPAEPEKPDLADMEPSIFSVMPQTGDEEDKNSCTKTKGCTATTHDDGCYEKCTGETGCTASAHSSGCKEICTGLADCEASNHSADCLSQQTTSAKITIAPATLSQGTVGSEYSLQLTASYADGTSPESGTWQQNGLPSGLSLSESGLISGEPTTAGTYDVKISFTDSEGTVGMLETELVILDPGTTVTYLGYIAQVTEVSTGTMKVMQTPYTYTITDLNNLPTVSVDVNALTEEATYVSALITETSVSVDDYLLIIVEQDGTLNSFVKQENSTTGEDTGASGEGTVSGGTMQSGTAVGSGASMGAAGQTQTYEIYSLDKLTIASVTSQEHMTVSITIDELDITSIYVGQKAIVSVDALGGEQFDAEITRISNSGENEGGNSKFTVEVTLGKSGDMLPGMYSSAFITLETSENVPCVPVAALGKDGVDSVLYTSYDADSGLLGDPIVVTIGCSDGENVEIVAGLALGEICYYEYYDTYVGSDNSRQQSGGFNLGAMMGGR